MIDLFRRSIEIILENQSENGAYIASQIFRPTIIAGFEMPPSLLMLWT